MMKYYSFLVILCLCISHSAFAQMVSASLDYICSVDVDEDTLWVSTSQCLVAIDKKSGLSTFHEVPNYRFADRGYRNYGDVIAKRGNNLWIGSNSNDIIKYRDGKMEYVYSVVNPRCLYIPSDDQIWIGGTHVDEISSQGDCLFHGFVPELTMFSTVQYYDLEPSRDGGIYIGIMCNSRYSGLYKLKDGEFTHLFKDCDVIYSLATDKNGNLWIAAYNGLYVYDGTTFTQFTPENSGFPSGRARSVEVDDEGNVWIGVNNQLAKYDGKEFTFYETDENTKYYFTSICIDGDVIYLGTGGLGMFRFENGKIEKMEISSTDNDNTDGIQEITERQYDNDASFSLDGRRVTDGYHGIVIKDGKKLIHQR